VRRALPVLAVALVVGAGCAHGLTGYEDTLSAWHGGERGAAHARAEREYRRFRDANALDEAAVRAEVSAARAALATRPMVPPRAAPLAPIPIDAGADPGRLSDALRADLLSGEATATLRGVAVVEGLRLRHHAPDLIAIVFHRGEVLADGGLLDDASRAMRSVAVKRMALDALESLSR